MRFLKTKIYRVLGLVTIAAGILVSLSFKVWADDISVDAALSDSTVELGSSAQLTVTVNGADNVPPLQIPKIDGLDIRYLGPSTQISIINGKMTRSTGLMFSVVPVKTGQFEIPLLTVSINGKDYVTAPVKFSVVNSGNTLPVPGTGAGGDSSSSSLQDKIFMVLGTSKKEAYINEPIPLVIKLFINGLNVRNVQYPTFDHDGFNAEDFKEPRQGQQSLGDIVYKVVEFKTVIYPTRDGELSLGPAKLGVNLIIKNSRRSGRFGEMDDFFNDDFLNNFFGNMDIKTLSLESANLGIKVNPLPDEGKPSEFSGGVGKYNFEMTVSPESVKVGDPLTVRMRVAGDGNMKTVNLPALKDTGDFKAYDPKITDQNGAKILEQVVIPLHDKITALPEVEFNYFDPEDKKYHRLAKGPFPLTVSALAKGEESKIVGVPAPGVLNAPSTNPEELGHDIHFIKEISGPFQKHGYAVYRDPLWVTGFALFILTWMGFLTGFMLKQKLSADVRLARRWSAPRQARDGLVLAQKAMKAGEAKSFYDAIFKTLQDYFGNKFHLTPGSVSAEMISGLMKPKDRVVPVLKELGDILAECDMARFASAQFDQETMSKTLSRAREIIDFYEKYY